MPKKPEDFGYENSLHQHYIDSGKIPKGTFQVKKRNTNYYWYYTLSKGKNRTKYICSVNWDGKDSDSFKNAINITEKKLKEDSQSNTSLLREITKYLKELENEITNPAKRTKKTIQDISYHIRKFREFVEIENLTLQQIQKKSFRKDFKKYIEWLEKDYASQSVRVIITHTRQFLDYLVDPTYRRSVIDKHFITSQFVTSEFKVNRGKNTDLQDRYSKENYDKVLDILIKESREIWREWIRNPKYVDRKKSAILISLLQLKFGFRISEIVDCYLSEKLKDKSHDGKKGYSYIDRDGKDVFIYVYKKRKSGIVMVDFELASWDNKPPKKINFVDRSKPNHQRPDYYTNIIDVTIELFGNDEKLISSHSTQVFKFIRDYVIDELELKKYGITRSHDFRDFFINYSLNHQKQPIELVSEMVRHSLQTLQKYYQHRNKEISKERAKELQTSKLYHKDE